MIFFFFKFSLKEKKKKKPIDDADDFTLYTPAWLSHHHTHARTHTHTHTSPPPLQEYCTTIASSLLDLRASGGLLEPAQLLRFLRILLHGVSSAELRYVMAHVYSEQGDNRRSLDEVRCQGRTGGGRGRAGGPRGGAGGPEQGPGGAEGVGAKGQLG